MTDDSDLQRKKEKFMEAFHYSAGYECYRLRVDTCKWLPRNGYRVRPEALDEVIKTLIEIYGAYGLEPDEEVEIGPYGLEPIGGEPEVKIPRGTREALLTVALYRIWQDNPEFFEEEQTEAVSEAA